MSKQLKFLQVSTLLRANIDLAKIPMRRLDDLLSEHNLSGKVDFVRSVEAILSGKVKIDFGISKVTFKHRISKSKRKDPSK